MITLRGKQTDVQAVVDALNTAEGYPDADTLTTAYVRAESDGDDYVLVLPDSDEERVKKHGKGKLEKGDTRVKKELKIP